MSPTPQEQIQITETHPLAKRNGESGWRESTKSHQALLDYWMMGSARSLPKLADRYNTLPEYIQPDHPSYRDPPTRQLQTLKRWSSEHEWQKRIGQAQLLWIEEMEETWRTRQLEIRDADYHQGQRLRDAIEEVVAQIPNFIQQRRRVTEENGRTREIVTIRLNESFFLKALQLASDLQRKASGLDKSTIVHEGTGDSGQILIELTDSNISPEDV